MKLNVEKALKVCGNNNIYQKLLYLAVALSWFSVDFVAISFPLLELEPRFSCRESEASFAPCTLKQACGLPPENFKVEVEYKNLLTDFKLYCDTTLVILIGVLYTLGILIGSIISSHFSDVLGRKPVLLMCQVLFGLAALSMTIAPNMYFVLCSLFLTGFASAGGTMVSFLYIYEVLSPSKRSLYGTLVNFSFAVAGMIYFTCFMYLKNWVYIAYICIVADFVAFLLVSLYFLESPRFLVSKGYYDKALKVLYKIAKKNGKSRDFYRYILSDMLYRNQSNSNNNNISSNNFKELRSSEQDNNSDYFKSQNNNKNNFMNENNNCDGFESNLSDGFKKVSDAKTNCIDLNNNNNDNVHFKNDLGLSLENNYSNCNTNTNNSNNNSGTRVIPSTQEPLQTSNANKKNNNNSFLKNIKINSNSITENTNNNNSLENSSLSAAPRRNSAPKVKESSDLNTNNNNNNYNFNNYSSSSENKSSSSYGDSDVKSLGSRGERSDSIDSKSMDIDEFIKKIQLQESAAFSSEQENERKNEPLLVSSKSTNFTDYKSGAAANEENSKKTKEQSFLALFKFKSLRYKFLICCLFWFVMSFTYYGMSFFLKKGGENVFLDGYIIYLAEGISYFVTGIIMSISFLGRVRSLSIMMMLTALSTIVFYYMKDVGGIYNKIPLFVARFSITSIYSIMYTYSTEVYPTSIRAKGLGLNSFCARISSILVPIIVELVDNPFVIFSGMTFVSFFFTFSLPETNNKELEDEILEEKIMQKKISIDTN